MRTIGIAVRRGAVVVASGGLVAALAVPVAAQEVPELVVEDGVTQPVPFADLSDVVLGLAEEHCGGCGMLSIAFAPDYEDEILKAALVTQGGAVVHPNLKS